MKYDFKLETRRCPISKTEKQKGKKTPAQKWPTGNTQNPWNSSPTPVARGGCWKKLKSCLIWEKSSQNVKNNNLKAPCKIDRSETPRVWRRCEWGNLSADADRNRFIHNHDHQDCEFNKWPTLTNKELYHLKPPQDDDFELSVFVPNLSSPTG